MIEVTQVSLSISCHNNYQHQLLIPRRCLRRKWSIDFSFFYFHWFKIISISFFVNSAIEERNKDQQPDLVRNSSQFSHHEPISSVPGMDDAEFRRRGKEMIDYIADYLKHIR
jgi:hypothetical protein